MRYVIAPEIFARFPGMRVAVAVAEGVENASPRPAVEALWRESWAAAGGLAAEYANAQSHPHVAPWREAFKVMGASPKEFRSSIEALLRRAMRGGEPFSINPLVDFYNAISLRHISPAGGFDLDQLGGDLLELRLSRAGEEFLALGASEPEAVPPGEVSYVADGAILTRHFVWRQSKLGALVPGTRTVFLVSEVLGGVEAHGGGKVAEGVLADFCAGLREYFGVEARAFLLEAGSPGCAW
jgi:DNA/RNA-binding domain of Phe-tRNA-synthetase-like protein